LVEFVWEFIARADKTDEFEQCYSATGRWSALFGKSPGYRGTTLLRDCDQPRRYLTIDGWDSAELYQAMRRNYAQEFEELDRRCEALTESERRIGAFEVV
jgi:heme-degrading monooxygenase HmoA